MGEDGGGQVDEGGVWCVDGFVGEEDAGDFHLVGAVVGGPGGIVIGEDFAVEGVAEAGVPGGAVVSVEADDEIGGSAGMFAGIYLIGAIDLADDGGAIDIVHGFKFGDQFFQQFFPFGAGIDDAVDFVLFD